MGLQKEEDDDEKKVKWKWNDRWKNAWEIALQFPLAKKARLTRNKTRVRVEVDPNGLRWWRSGSD
jgi:hypothetical protein